MNAVGDAGAMPPALAQAWLESEVSLRMLKLNQQVDRQQADLVRELLDATAAMWRTDDGRLDTYA